MVLKPASKKATSPQPDEEEEDDFSMFDVEVSDEDAAKLKGAKYDLHRVELANSSFFLYSFTCVFVLRYLIVWINQ